MRHDTALTKQRLALLAVESHVRAFGMSPTLDELASFLAQQGVYQSHGAASMGLRRMRCRGLLWPTTARTGLSKAASLVSLTRIGREVLVA